MGKKRLMINMVANLTALLVQFGINFVLTPYITETLGEEAYGFIPISTNLVNYVNIITVALNSMAARFITIEMKQNNDEKAKEYFSSVLAANTILALCLSIPGSLLLVFVDKIFNVPLGLVSDVRLTMAFVLITTAVNLFFNVFGSSFYITNRLDITATRGIIGNVLRAGVLVALFCIFAPHIYYVTATTLIIALYTGISSFIISRKMTPELKFQRKYVRWGAIRTLLASGVWNSVNQLSAVLLATLDLYLANILIDASASGSYSLAKTVPNFLHSVSSTLVSVFVPTFMALYAQKKTKELVREINFSIKVKGYLMTLPIGFLIIFGKEFFRLWVPSQDASLLHGLSLITIIPMIVTTAIGPLYNIFTVTNKLRPPAICLLIAGIVNTIGVVILVKTTSLGVWAIPIMSCVVLAARNLIFTPIYGAKCLGVSPARFYLAVLRAVGCGLTMCGICFGYRELFRVDALWKLILAAAVCALLAMAVNIWIVFNKTEIKKVFGMIKNKFRKKSKPCEIEKE